MKDHASMDELFTAFCAAAGIQMDSHKDHADFAARGELHEDPGSDVHDGQERP